MHLFNRHEEGYGIINLKRTILAVFVLLITTSSVDAHGFCIYVSTPVSPPDGFQWVAPAFLIVLFVVNALLIGLFRLAGWVWAALAAFLAVSISAAWFLFLGMGGGYPLPGLGWGNTPFMGLTWKDIGWLFVNWNLLGLVALLVALTIAVCFRQIARKRKTVLILLSAVFILLGFSVILKTCAVIVALLLFIGLLFVSDIRQVIRQKRLWVLLAVNVILYALCLVPFIAKGALTSGWTGGYVHGNCKRQIARLGLALVEYAKEHDGQLPTGKSMEEVFPKIKPYIKDFSTRFDDPIYVCPAVGAYMENPIPYEWNPKLSGKKVSELEDNYCFEPVFTCPYHSRLPLFAHELAKPEESFLFKDYLEYGRR